MGQIKSLFEFSLHFDLNHTVVAGNKITQRGLDTAARSMYIHFDTDLKLIEMFERCSASMRQGKL